MKPPQNFWQFRLYIAGNVHNATRALNNLKTICNEHLADHYHIEVIDLALTPNLADQDEIFALPALVRAQPPPKKKIIGDLSNREEVINALQLPVKEATG